VLIVSSNVEGASYPDVIVTSISYNSTTGNYTSIIKNQGAIATPVGVYVGVSYSIDGVYKTWGSVKGPLAAGASVSIGNGGGPYFIPVGTHTITVFADDALRFSESNETNNKLSKSITIADTSAPSYPNNLIATTISSSQINLTWKASSDNVGVTGYQIERCQGVNCTTFALIGSSIGNSYSDSILLAGTSYSYRVRASDAAKNFSLYSPKATALTTSASTSLPDVVVTNISYDPATGNYSSIVKNQGTSATPVGVYVGVSYSVDGIYKTWGSVMGPLAAGASVTIGNGGGPYMIPAGTHTISVIADDAERFTESKELNNQLTLNVNISVTPPKDLFTPPALVNPVDPMSFGAKCDGVTDDSAAFQAAVNASDVLIPAKTCLINKTVYVSTSNKHIECAKGAILKHTDPYAGNMIRVIAWDAPITDISIVNCNFLGTNTVAPQFFVDDNRHWDIPVETFNTVNNFYVAGNTFERFFGQSMVQTYSPSFAGSNARIEYNTFKSCGYYGPVLVASTNSYIGHNTLVDCAAGVENDNATQATGGNIIEYNTLTAINGYGATDMSASVLLTGGGAGNANYSTNIVRYNTVSGVGSAARGSLPSMIYEYNLTGAAQYIGNSCLSGCIDIK